MPRGGVEVLLYSFFNLGVKCEWMDDTNYRPLYSGERKTVPIVQEAVWAPGMVLTGAENLPSLPIGIRSLAIPVHSEML
jgi:hypothetical protein